MLLLVLFLHYIYKAHLVVKPHSIALYMNITVSNVTMLFVHYGKSELWPNSEKEVDGQCELVLCVLILGLHWYTDTNRIPVLLFRLKNHVTSKYTVSIG